MTSSSETAHLSNLLAEHRLIRAVLDALEVYGERFGSGGAVERDDLAQFARFFTEFAELVHHVKEEDILLPTLVRHGFDWDTGPVHNVRTDHEQERYLVNVLRQAASQEGGFGREDRRHAAASIAAFVDFERKHVQREDSQLLPAAIERLSDEDLAEIEARLDEFDTVKFGKAERDALISLGEKLAERYAPSKAG